MRFALIGLAGMAGNMARRLRRQDVEVVGCDEDAERVGQLAEECGVIVTTSMVAALRKLPGDAPKVVWLMLPNSAAVDREIKNLANRLSPGDVVVDGSHSNYRDSQRRGALLSQSGIGFVDAGILEGGNGVEQGFCITAGGERDHVKSVAPLFQVLAAGSGAAWSHVGVAGAGHFARMVHSGIEWSVRQAFSEGLTLLQGKTNIAFDLEQVAKTWSQGSVLAGAALNDEVAKLGAASTTGVLPANFNELSWVAVEAIDQHVSVPVTAAVLQSVIGKPRD